MTFDARVASEGCNHMSRNCSLFTGVVYTIFPMFHNTWSKSNYFIRTEKLNFEQSYDFVCKINNDGKLILVLYLKKRHCMLWKQWSFFYFWIIYCEIVCTPWGRSQGYFVMLPSGSSPGLHNMSSYDCVFKCLELI